MLACPTMSSQKWSGWLPHILLVEDDEAMGESLSDLLRRNGFTVEWAKNGLQGLQRAKARPPAAIVLDIGLPIVDGSQFVAEYRAGTQVPAPIVIVSAVAELPSRAKALGAAGFLSKPVDHQYLLAEVRRITADRFTPPPTQPPTGGTLAP